MSDPTRAQLNEAIKAWHRAAQQLLDAVAAEQTAWLALSSTSTLMWLAAHHSWQVTAETAHQAMYAITGARCGWYDITAYDYLTRRYGIDESDAHRLIDRYELDQRPISAMDEQLQQALGPVAGLDYLAQLHNRSEIAGRTLVASALLAS